MNDLCDRFSYSEEDNGNDNIPGNEMIDERDESESEIDEVAVSNQNNSESVKEVFWGIPQLNFVPKKTLEAKGILVLELDRSATGLDVLLKF